MLVLLLALVFAAVELLPGDAASASSERGDGAAGVEARRHLLGLDRPVWERFADWMTALPTGDLGTSARGQKVTDLLADPLPNTLLLGGTAFLLTVLASLALGCWAACRPGGSPTGSSRTPPPPPSRYPSSSSPSGCSSSSPCGAAGCPPSPSPAPTARPAPGPCWSCRSWRW